MLLTLGKDQLLSLLVQAVVFESSAKVKDYSQGPYTFFSLPNLSSYMDKLISLSYTSLLFCPECNFFRFPCFDQICYSSGIAQVIMVLG